MGQKEEDTHNYFRQPDDCFCFGGSCRRQYCPAKKVKTKPPEKRAKSVEAVKRDGKTIYTYRNSD